MRRQIDIDMEGGRACERQNQKVSERELAMI